MEIDAARLNRLYRLVADTEQKLMTTVQYFGWVREEIDKLRQAERERLAALEVPPPPHEDASEDAGDPTRDLLTDPGENEPS